jgi:hypothetical protein
MKLRSADESTFELSPVSYFLKPSTLHVQALAGDEDWLVIRAFAQLADGRSWSFLDPCLTARDVRSLVQWLDDVAQGIVPAEPFDDEWPESLLFFTEPLLAFSVAFLGADRASIRVHFGAEALPPWLPEDQQSGIYEFFLVLDVGRKHLGDAAAELSHELESVPER